MIKAGFKAYVETSKNDADVFLTAIYEAMSDQKQKDALIEYRKHYKNTIDNIGHSNR